MRLIEFADYVALMVVAHNTELLEMFANPALKIISL